MANEILPITEAEVVLYQPDDNISLEVKLDAAPPSQQPFSQASLPKRSYPN